MSWWFKDNHNPSFRSRNLSQSTRTFLLGGVFVSVLILSSVIGADSLQEECGKLQHKCMCGVPRCIEPELVNNGVSDCIDGSDEGQWNPSKCAIKNNTSEDIRFKRAAISELLRETNGGATTTYFEAERGRTRPIGLLTTTLGSFVTTGTTTEYITKLLATYIRGTYARILSTSSRIYHAIPTDGGDMMDNVIKPTGFIASTVSTEIHGYATTAHRTDFYRTYIDGTYAQLVSSYSSIYFPPWYTDPIVATTVFTGSEESPEQTHQQSEGIYATPVLNFNEIPGSVRTMQVGKFGTVMLPPIIPTQVVGSQVGGTRAPAKFPEELNGSFIPKNDTNFNALAELGLVIGAAVNASGNGNRLRALRPNNMQENEVRVTGTHGNFIHTDVRSGDETTYNVFTGTYIQDAKTYLFFFGNTAIGASRAGQGGQQTILVENGPQKNNLVVDMTDKLRLVVPAHKDRSTIDGSIAGRHMEGVVVEIESSEGSPLIEDELITVTGATQQKPTPRDPRIDMVTVTLEKNNKISQKTATFSTSSSSSSSGFVSKNNENENEIPTGRKVGNRGRDGSISEAASFLRPTQAARPISIPTYTVGQDDNIQYESSTQKEVEVVYNLEKNVEARVSNGGSKGATAPVFQRPKSLYPKNVGQQGRSVSSRNQKSSFSDANEIDPDLDLQSAASTGRATVTYVGFADFTTTVGNTVIVFMPRTKMIEDLSVHSSSTLSRASSTKITPTVTRFQNIDPTRYVYTTTTEADEGEFEATTPKRPEVPAPPVVLSSSRLQPSSRGSRKSSSSQPEAVASPTVVDVSPSETTILLSGTQTVFTNLDHHDSRILEQQQGIQTILFDSSSGSFVPEPTPVPPRFVTITQTSSPVSPRNSLVRPRQRFSAVQEVVSPSAAPPTSSVSIRSRLSPYAKSSSERSESVEPPLTSPAFRPPIQSVGPSVTTNGQSSTATTAVYQTDKVNPTGLVTSIAGSIVRDRTTTLFTSLVYGTFIGSSYAQVIKSTSTVYFIIPSKSLVLESPKLSPSATPVFSQIRPTPAAKFSGLPVSSSFSFEVTTTEHSTEPEDESETTTSSSSSSTSEQDSDLPETTTTSGKGSDLDIIAEEIPTTTGRIPVVVPKEAISASKTKPDRLSELDKRNEIDRGRKVSGRPQDQVILETTSSKKGGGRYSTSSRSRYRGSSGSSSSSTSSSSSPAVDEVIEKPTSAITEIAATEDQTIFVTRTVPTTVYRTYTYYTTFYIPKEEETVTSIISREVTSTAVGFVKKTFSNVVPTSSSSAPVAFDIPATKSTVIVSPSVSVESSEIPKEEKIKPASSSLVYKTFFTTYTYLTTFFTGQTSSVSSREEIVSSVVTLTQTGDSASSKSDIIPTVTPSILATDAAVSSVLSPSPTLEPLVSSTSLVLRTRTRTFTAPTEGETVGRGRSPAGGKYSIIKRLRSSPLAPTPTLDSETLLVSPTFEGDLKSPEVQITSDLEEPSSSTLIPSVVEHTILRTFFTTYTYFTTLFNGQDASTKTRTEVISNTVPTTVRSTITPILSSSGATKTSSNRGSKSRNPEDTETTFFTTYTYITTALNEGVPSESSSVDTFSNVLRGDTTIRSGFVTKTKQVGEIQPTAIVGRTAPRGNPKNQIREKEPEHAPDDLNEVGSNLSETSETTPSELGGEVTTVEPQSDYYELESSEMTTERSVYNEHEHFDEDSPKKKMNRGGVSPALVGEDENELATATPALKTYFTTFTFYTTFYKGGASTVSSRLETVTNVGSDIVSDGSATEAPETQIPAYPITYFTTYTYWTTSFKDKSAVVTSREETVSNVVTPGIDDIAPSTTARSVPQASKTREAKVGEVGDTPPVEVVPTETEIDPDMELTTYFTTYTYYTTSYIGEDTIINSRLETVTNVISGTPSATLDSEENVSKTSEVSPTPSSSISSSRATKIQSVNVDGSESADHDYDLPVGLLSSIVSSEVVDKTTTLFSTDVYGTYIDGIYAQVLDSTSKVINPTVTATVPRETKFITEGSETTATGLLEINAGKTVEANQAVTTFYTTKTYGTVIDGKYAQLLESTSSVTKVAGTDIVEDPLKTGLVRIIDGSLVKGDKTTYYTSSVLGTVIGSQYAQVIESTSRYVIGPTATVQSSVTPTVSQPTIIVESSEGTTESDDIGATTEKESQSEDDKSEESSQGTPELQSSRKYNGRDRSSRLSFSAPTSKSFAPFITPFASRSRPAFAPKRKQSSAVIVTRTDVTPTVTATLAPASASRNLAGSSRGNSFQNRQKFRRPNEQGESSDSNNSPTPGLPVSPSRSRFQRPRPGGSSTEGIDATGIQPTSTSGSPVLGGSSPAGSRGRGVVSRAGASQSAPARNRGSVSASRAFTSLPGGSSSSAGSRGAVSSRFAIQRQKSSSSRESPLSPTRASAITTVKPTQAPEVSEDEEEQTDYEPEGVSPTPATKPAATTQANRFGSNRFRLNPRLPASSLTTTTTGRPSTTSRELPFLRRQTFTRPTLPTKGTTTAAPSSANPGSDEEYEEDKEEPKETIPAPTQKPVLSLKSLIGSSRPVSRASPAAPRQRTITTTPAPTARTTTKRAFAPRVRPAGFPSKGLFRPSTSETSTEVADELEHEETQNVPGRMIKRPLVVSGTGSASEQRVTGGRLFIQSGRNLATKVMSNGVEVIVRGDKTGFVGFPGTPVFPSPVTPQAITLPPSTVSRQFHLVEHPNKPNNAIDHLLHSIVRSATLDMVTKTLLTTFTFLTTVLEDQNTVVSSREEIISNVVTRKFHPTIEYTPSVKAETSSMMSPEFPQQSFGSSYLTSTLTTTYTYFNTFSGDSFPVILSSIETISNVITIPAYLNPTSSPSFELIYPSESSRVFETETYHTTYTFSKTFLDEETNQTQVVTTEETLTQIVVTEALIPAQSYSTADLLTPTPPKKTFYTSSTFFTTLLEGSNLVTKSVVEVNSNVVDEYQGQLQSPTFLPDHNDFSSSTPEVQKVLTSQAKLLKSTAILATNTYFTTYTYFTTVLGEGTETDIQSRTQVVSEVLTEALPSSILDADELSALKSSYLAEHSTLLEISSSIHEINPTRTIEGTYYPQPSKITKYPYWPKDEDEGIMDPEFDDSDSKSPTAIEEMKEEIHHIVNVLADTAPANDHDAGTISPDSPHTHRPLYSTIDRETTPEIEFEEVTLRTPNDLLDEIGSTVSTTDEVIEFDTERPISHIPTPPLKSSAPSLQYQKNEVTNGLFPDLPTRVRNPINTVNNNNKYPEQIEHLEHDPIYGNMNLGDISSIVDVYFTNVYVKNKLTAIPVLSGTGVLKKDNTTMPIDKVDVAPTSVSSVTAVDQTQEIFNLLSELTNEEVNPPPDYYDEINEEDAFKDTDDEVLASKIYTLSNLASTTVNKKRGNATDTRVALTSSSTTTEPPTEPPGNIEYDYVDTTTDTPTGSGDGGEVDDFIVPPIEDPPDDFVSEKIIPEETGGLANDDTEASSERVTLIKWAANGEPDHSEIVMKLTTKKKPSSEENKRTSVVTTKRPKTNKPTLSPMHDYDDSSEGSTKVYNLLIRPNQNSADDNSEVVDDILDDNKSEAEGGKTDEESQEDNIRRPTGVFGGTGPAPSMPSGPAPSGPSKSSLSLAGAGPGIGVNTGSHIVTSSTSGINWTPLLNLGALGLGGLGASTLTKFSPFLSSMAGYLKSGFVPVMARNDTQYYKQERPPYMRYPPPPPHEGAIMTHHEPPNYIPIGKQKPPLYRHPDDSIPRRPIISHADEPNFRPLANNREPQDDHRPGGHRFENNRFPPTHNYNFKPPHDQQPDIFTQMGTNTINNLVAGGGGTRVVSGNHLDAGVPSQNIVKVVSGNIITALPAQVNRSPEPFFFGKNKETVGGDGQSRRPIFIRPPPRSQESQSGYQQHIILPLPPESDEINTKHQIPLKVGAAEIQKVNRPFVRPQLPPPQPQPPGPTPFQQQQTFSNSPYPPDLQGQSDNTNNFHRPAVQPTRQIPNIPPPPPPQQPFSGEHVNKLFFNNAEMPGGSENPFNRHPQRPGFGIIEKQRRPPMVLRDSSEESPRPTDFHPPSQPSISQFSPPPSFNFIPPTHYPAPQNNFKFNRDPFNPRPSSPQNQRPDFIAQSSEEYPNNFGMSSNNRPQNHFGHNVHNPNVNLVQRPPQPMSDETSGENGYFRPPNYPPPAFRPNIDSMERPSGQNQPEPPFRPILTPNQNNGYRPSNQNEVQVQIHPNHKYTPLQSEERLEPKPTVLLPGMNTLPEQSDERFEPTPTKFPVLLPGMNQNHPQQSGERLEKPPNLNKVLLPGMNSPHWNPNGNANREHSGEHSQENEKSPDNSGSYERFRRPQLESPKREHPQSDLKPPQREHPQSDLINPTPQFPPFKQRPSTIFIVHETYDPVPDDSEEQQQHQGFSSTSFPPISSTTERPDNSQESTSKKYPQLIIKEVSPVPYAITTPKPLTTIVKVNPTFIRRSTTTPKPHSSTTTTESPISTNYVEPDHGSSFSGFVISPTMQDLLNIGNNHPANSISESELGFGGKVRPSSSEIKNKFSGSLTSPKKPFDFDKYFTNTGDNSFGQTFSGSEDNESIIDPVNQQVIKSPFDPIRSTNKPNEVNLSNHKESPPSTTTAASTISQDSEEDLLRVFAAPDDFLSHSTPSDRLWWPTTFKPAHRPFLSSVRPDHGPSNELLPVSETSGIKPYNVHFNPTTFKNTMRPTTYRPRRPEQYNPMLRNPLLSRPPQQSFGQLPFPYDDEEGLKDIKIKNVEIYKNPNFYKNQNSDSQNRPISQPHPVLSFLPTSLEDEDELEEQSYESENEKTPNPSPAPTIRDKRPSVRPQNSYDTNEEQDVNNNQQLYPANKLVNDQKVQSKPNDESHQTSMDSPENNKNKANAQSEYDTNESFELVPPNYPVTRLRPPPPYPPNFGNGNGDNRNRPFIRQPPPGPPQQTKRPGPLEAITNIFRRPNLNGRPNQPGQGPPVQNFGPPGQGPPVQNFGPPGQPPPPPPQFQPGFSVPSQQNNNPPPPPPLQGRPQANNNQFIRQPSPPRQNNNGPPPPPPNSNFRRPVRPEISDNFEKVRPIPLNPNAGTQNQRPGPINQNTGNQNQRPNNILPGLIRRPLPQQPGQDNSRDKAPEEPQRPILIRRPNPVIRGPPQDSNALAKPPPIPSSESPLDPNDSYYYEDEELPEDNDVLIDKSSTTSKSGLGIFSSTTPVVQNQEKVPVEKVSESPKESEETKSEERDPTKGDQKPAAASDPSYEEIDEEGDEESEGVVPTKVEPETSPNRPIHIGGHLLNHNAFRPHTLRIPKPVIPQRGTFVFERPPIQDSSEFLGTPSPPKTEMEPPPIDSLRLKPSILELPSNGPIRYRPGRPGAQEVNLRPNLLRPDDDLLKPTLARPKPTFHTIASVDDDNKIVGTNVVEAPSASRTNVFSSIKSTVSTGSEKITPTKTIIGSVETVGLDADISSSMDDDLPISSTLIPDSSDSTTSVVEYSGGVLKTVVLNAENEKVPISPSRTFTRTIVRTRQSEEADGESSSATITPTKSSDSISEISATAQVTPPTRTRGPGFQRPTIPTLPEKPKPEYNPFIPSRGPPSPKTPPGFPWLRRSTSTSTISPSTEVTRTPIRFPSTIVPRDRVTLKYNRTRPFSVNSVSTAITTTESNALATEESKNSPAVPISAPPVIRTHFNETYRPTTFRPPIKPDGNNREKVYGNNTISFVVSSNSSTSQGTLRKGVIVSTHKPTTSTTPEDISEEDDEFEEESDEVVQIPLLTKNGTVSVVTNVNRIVPSRTPPTLVRKPQVVAVSTVSSVTVKSSSMSTRLVTSTETSTQTITETETTVVSAAAGQMTHTIMITKTLPPQTLISTIVGTVTVVNTVEVTPTTVRSTIFAVEPTKSVTSFTGSPDLSGPSRTTEKVLQSGVVPTASKPVTKPIPSPPTTSEPSRENVNGTKKINHNLFDVGCKSNCSMQGNQLCRRFGTGNSTKSKCVCKPGYARMRSTKPCTPTFTYEMSLSVNHMEGMTFDFRDLRNEATDAYSNFISVTKDALDKAFLSTDLKRQFQGAEIMKIEPTVMRNNKTSIPEPKVNVDFLVQLSVNMTEDRIKNHFIRTLKASNFSVGRTGVTTTKNMSDFAARDFNECSMPDYNDCSIHAECINLRGSFLCQCLFGFKDRSKKYKPGRDCLEMAGCAECNYKGNCYPDKQGNNSCDCFRWYGGAECQINLKILLMTIIGVGAVLFVLVLLCGVLVCKRNRRTPDRPGSGRFMRYRSPTSPATLERAAIMHDSGSSDGCQTPPVRVNAHQPYTPDSLLIDQHDDKTHRRARPGDVNLMNFSLRNVVMDQDRSLTVVIPRAKIRPSSRPTPGTSGGGPDGSDLAATEKKLINYLDQGPYPLPTNKMGGKTAGSSRQSTLQRNNEASAFRKLSLQERRISSGALVSSGTEVSARGGMRRRSTGLEPELPFRGYEKTVSDVRSYDETTVKSHARPLFASETSRTSCYSCKPPSYCAYSESAGHTMAEKDGASTVYTTQGKLFRMSQDTDSNLSSD